MLEAVESASLPVLAVIVKSLYRMRYPGLCIRNETLRGLRRQRLAKCGPRTMKCGTLNRQLLPH